MARSAEQETGEVNVLEERQQPETGEANVLEERQQPETGEANVSEERQQPEAGEDNVSEEHPEASDTHVERWELPEKLRHKRAVWNIENKDGECFYWCI